MNTELTADAAVDAVETIVWRYDNAEEITRGMLRDANEGVAALRLVIEALPDLMTLYRLKWGNRDTDANAVYIRMENALDECRKVDAA